MACCANLVQGYICTGQVVPPAGFEPDETFRCGWFSYMRFLCSELRFKHFHPPGSIGHCRTYCYSLVVQILCRNQTGGA